MHLAPELLEFTASMVSSDIVVLSLSALFVFLIVLGSNEDVCEFIFSIGCLIDHTAECFLHDAFRFSPCRSTPAAPA